MNWLDREGDKKRISNWLSSYNDPFLFTILDSQEFEDITDWVTKFPNTNCCTAYLNTDSEVTRFGLLEGIVNDKGVETFPRFKDRYDRLAKKDFSFIINQTIGSDLSSESSITFSSNSQEININNLDPDSLRQFYFDNNVNDFFYDFLQDLNLFSEKNLFLIICRIRGGGFHLLDGKFKSWFQEQFIRRLKEKKIKILILCQQNSDPLFHSFDYNNQASLKHLHLNDILPISKEVLNDDSGFFCRGIVDEQNEVPYRVFKSKLQKNKV